ncbi:MAG: D-cysteine desulfhydrase family protein [Candidatus Eisenbacteria bacterium]|nr:D-cysteine desulfhydrase family protein [Candidatus Eisenbacteria bacterium]
MDLPYPPRVSLGCFPTRVEQISRFPLRDGAPVWIKRDDQSGSDLSGNKVRKLEFLLAEALEGRCDVVITCGGTQSNHCRATAIAARRLGIDSVLFLRADRPAVPEGNLLLDLLAGARVVTITPEEYRDRDAIMRAEADRLRSEGRRPYPIVEGGSNALGAWGYIAMLDELRRQGLADRMAHLVCATGSAGTLAGLHLGIRLLGLRIRPWGVAVCDDAAYFRGRVIEIAREFRGRFGIGDEIRADEIDVVEGYKGPGYAKTYPRLLDLARRMAREEGIFLDPVYTGKAFLAMIDLLADGTIPRDEEVLFLHTGGIFSLFAYRDELLAEPA